MHHKAKQSFICEECEAEGITTLDEMNQVLQGKRVVCNYCNRLI